MTQEDKELKIKFSTELEKLEYERCIKYINTHDVVCDECGNKSIEPIHTEDNLGRSTYWLGCKNCCHFTYGTSHEIYSISKRLVTTDKKRIYHFSECTEGGQIKGFCDLIERIQEYRKMYEEGKL